MKKLVAYAMVVGMFLTLTTAARAGSIGSNITILSVGTNNHTGFESTGGTGAIEGQGDGQATITKNFTALGDVPIILQLTPSTGLDVLHISERVTNNTGVPWTDFHLIFATIDSGPMTVQFLNTTNSTGEFNTIIPQVDALTLIGPVPDGHTFSLSFDLQAAAVPGAFNLFGIHETPSTPEPGSVVLFSMGMLGLGGVAVRKRRRHAGLDSAPRR